MESTLGLRDNPFDPEVPGFGRLAGRALTVDTNPELISLVCLKVAALRKAEENLLFAVFHDDAAANAAVKQSIILLIVGPRGSGRSTLTSLIRKRILEGKKPGGAVWETFDLSFDVFLPTPDPEKVEAQFQDLRGKIQKHFSDGAGQALVMADNLPKSYFDNVMSVFNAFPKLLRVFIVTSNDETLTERDLDAAGPVIERVELPKLTADEVQAFIAERVPKYLACNIPILSTDEALALFPFANTAPQSAVGTAGSKPIGAVNMWLRRRVLEQHRELLERKDLLDVAKAGLAELRTRLIP